MNQQAPDSASDQPAKSPGLLVQDRYRLVRAIGSGGMGEVYEALHLELSRRVAIKFMRPPPGSNEEWERRFLRESRALARCYSAHVVSVIDFGSTDEGELFLVMEYLHGSDLRRLLDVETRLPWERATRIVLGALRGVHSAHVEGLLHRDLKPENLFVVRESDGTEYCTVLDFGIVKVPNKTTLTGERAILGTPGYMAPEQVKRDEPLDVRADVFALGAILYECLRGTPAFEGERDDVLYQTMRTRPCSLALLDASLPSELVRAVDKSLQLDPAERFPNVLSFGTALEAVLNEERQPSARSDVSNASTEIRTTTGAVAGAAFVSPQAPARRSPRRLALGATLLCAAASVAGGGYWLGGSGSAQRVSAPPPHESEGRVHGDSETTLDDHGESTEPEPPKAQSAATAATTSRLLSLRAEAGSQQSGGKRRPSRPSAAPARPTKTAVPAASVKRGNASTSPISLEANPFR